MLAKGVQAGRDQLDQAGRRRRRPVHSPDPALVAKGAVGERTGNQLPDVQGVAAGRHPQALLRRAVDPPAEHGDHQLTGLLARECTEVDAFGDATGPEPLDGVGRRLPVTNRQHGCTCVPSHQLVDQGRRPGIESLRVIDEHHGGARIGPGHRSQGVVDDLGRGRILEPVTEERGHRTERNRCARRGAEHGVGRALAAGASRRYFTEQPRLADAGRARYDDRRRWNPFQALEDRVELGQAADEWPLVHAGILTHASRSPATRVPTQLAAAHRDLIRALPRTGRPVVG